MTKQTCGRYGVVVAIAILAWSAAVTAQTAAPDPWRRVPPVPTSHYAGDDFQGKVIQAIATLDADISRQDTVNTEIKQRFSSMDMSEKMQRMRAYMMKNPQSAAAMIQGMQASGEAVNSSAAASAPDSAKLDQDLDTQTANFRAAIDKAVKPLQAKEAELIKTKTKPAGEAGFSFVSAADQAAYLALVQQENTEYEKVGVTFFGPMGVFPSWLGRYKTFVLNDMIAPRETIDASIVTQMAIMDSPSGGYRSTAKLEGVRDYLRKVNAVYNLRRFQAAPDLDYAPLR